MHSISIRESRANARLGSHCVDNSSTRRSLRQSLLSLAVVVALCSAPLAAFGEETDGALAKEGGLGIASAIVSLVYAPIKVVYAVGGLVVGGLAWAFSGGDSQVAQVVLTPSLRGDYVITTSQLTGEKGIEFFGRAPRGDAGSSTAVASAPDDWAEGW